MPWARGSRRLPCALYPYVEEPSLVVPCVMELSVFLPMVYGLGWKTLSFCEHLFVDLLLRLLSISFGIAYVYQLSSIIMQRVK